MAMAKPQNHQDDDPRCEYRQRQSSQQVNQGEYSDLAEIPIVMVSSIQEDPATLFPTSGEVPLITPDAYFTKPLEIPRFLDCIRQMLNE